MAKEYQKYLTEKYTPEQYRKLTSAEKIKTEKEFHKKNKVKKKKD